jgi:hypothetical protein
MSAVFQLHFRHRLPQQAHDLAGEPPVFLKVWMFSVHDLYAL